MKISVENNLQIEKNNNKSYVASCRKKKTKKTIPEAHIVSKKLGFALKNTAAVSRFHHACTFQDMLVCI